MLNSSALQRKVLTTHQAAILSQFVGFHQTLDAEEFSVVQNALREDANHLSSRLCWDAKRRFSFAIPSSMITQKTSALNIFAELIGDSQQRALPHGPFFSISVLMPCHIACVGETDYLAKGPSTNSGHHNEKIPHMNVIIRGWLPLYELPPFRTLP